MKSGAINWVITFTITIIAILIDNTAMNVFVGFLYLLALLGCVVRPLPLADWHLNRWQDACCGIIFVVLLLATGHYVLATLAASATIVDVFNR